MAIKLTFQLFKVAILLMTLAGVFLYFVQERLIFFPDKLSPEYKFRFDQPFEELYFKSSDNTLLHGLLFKSAKKRGLIFYLHGNAGSLDSWGNVAKTYTELNYDVFMPDYRGYGKSQGKITSQQKLLNDLQTIYDQLKLAYDEERIVVLGYSIGTGPATKLAATNQPRLLILQAPYYSLTDLVKHLYPMVPAFLLKYKFETNKWIQQCKMPVVIFHGDQDEVIYYNSSIKLRKEMKQGDTLITLVNQGHNDITGNPQYKTEIKRILANHFIEL